MSLTFLKIKHKTLAAEAKIIRKEEIKHKKWVDRIVVQEVPFGDNYAKSLTQNQKPINWVPRTRYWQVKVLPCPQGHPDMTEEERRAYRENVWKHRARLRKLNPAHNPDLRHQLHEHRIKVVRPEARATHLALAYLKGQHYKTVEFLVRDDNKPNSEKIWRMVTKFGNVDDNEENKKKLKDWLTQEV